MSIQTIAQSMQDSFGRRISVWEQGEQTVVATAWSLEDGTPVTLFVSPLADDLFAVSDAGLAAGALADAGVDLSNGAAGASFELIRAGLRLAPAMGDQGHWDLTATAATGDIGDAVIELSEAVVRSEGLKALARRRPTRTFSDRIVRSAGEVGLKIEPKARLPLRYKDAKRTVSLRLIGKNRDVFVQSISRSSAMGGYDHARALFADAAVDSTRRMSAIENGAPLEAWQVEGLSDVSRVVFEGDLEKVLADIA